MSATYWELVSFHTRLSRVVIYMFFACGQFRVSHVWLVTCLFNVMRTRARSEFSYSGILRDNGNTTFTGKTRAKFSGKTVLL